jgi:hypothetical protein
LDNIDESLCFEYGNPNVLITPENPNFKWKVPLVESEAMVIMMSKWLSVLPASSIYSLQRIIVLSVKSV